MNYRVIAYMGGHWVRNGDLWQATDDMSVLLQDSDGYFLKFCLLPGFMTDGGSVPKAFQWLVPGWSADNQLLCLAYALHDYCYGSECLGKQDSDDLVRGMLRDSGMSRFKAGLVHQAVYRFAGNHYGMLNDKWDCALFGSMRRYR